jgi:hypothetical protein
LHLSHFTLAILQSYLGARRIGDSVQIVCAERDETIDFQEGDNFELRAGNFGDDSFELRAWEYMI